MMRLTWMMTLALTVAGLPCFSWAQETFEEGEAVKIDRLEAAPEVRRTKPYFLFLKAGYQYDDNVRLEPLDTDVSADAGDSLFEGFFYGRYSFIRQESFVAGAGYSHYQSLHRDLEEFDITGSIGRIYLKYRLRPVTFGLTYLPAYFWVNADDYLLRHQIVPEMTWKMSDGVYTKLGYGHAIDSYRQDSDGDKDGNINRAFLELGVDLFDKDVFVFGRMDYADNSADAPDESYDQVAAKLGLYFNMPWSMKLSMSGKYHHRTYGADAGAVEREDDKVIGNASLSADLYVDWLSIIAEYEYTRNSSNEDAHDYDRNMVMLSLALRI